MSTATLSYDGKDYQLDVIKGSENEIGIDISKLRADSGLITFDPGYGNTGSCTSAITFISGEKGILRYRGYSIEDIANKKASFTEVCYLLIYGKRPSADELTEFNERLAYHTLVHEDMKKFFEGYPPTAHPMAMMSAMVVSLSSYYPGLQKDENLDLNIIRILAKAATIAAFSYKKSIGQPFMYPKNGLNYSANFLHMMFAVPSADYVVPPVLEEALNLLLVLHADHEQNCSTSTMRMVGSSQANLFASLGAAICALWGPLHGGANQRVIEMLDNILAEGISCKDYLNKVKDKSSNVRLMGFGHRVYKNFDPRATLLKKSADRIFEELGINDPLLELAQELEDAALHDDYFIERKLYPNVDFYSGIIYRAMGIPTKMFTVMFALGRLPGWIAHWTEMRANEAESRIHRPRQVYTGPTARPFD